MAQCQCENKVHYGNSPGVHLFEEVKATQKVNSRHGTFNACKPCANKHLKAFQETNEETGSLNSVFRYPFKK